MKKLFIIGCLISILTSCHNTNSDKTECYKLISYLDINIDSTGRLPQTPYVVDLEKENKHLIVIGTLHSRDTCDEMFTEIEKIFANMEPEVAINEGGEVSKVYADRNSAIKNNGEIGLLKFLCDKQQIKMMNGDMPDDAEFEELAKNYSKDEALFFFASERFILPYTYWGESGNLDSLYKSDFIDGYLEPCGIELTTEEKEFSYYQYLYKKYYKKDFNIDSICPDNFSPIRKNGHFCDVARKSKELRDQYLLQQIEEQLTNHDKVLVIFGGWHVLAIEPALTQIINKKEMQKK